MDKPPIYIKLGSMSIEQMIKLRDLTKRPVFFVNSNPNDCIKDEEVSLRDRFAGQAITGILANTTMDNKVEIDANIAYAIADAMLLERAKGNV